MKFHHSVAIIFLLSDLLSQSFISDELPIGLTEEEENNFHLIYEMGRNTDQPVAVSYTHLTLPTTPYV